MTSRTLRRVTALAVVLAGCTSAATPNTTTTTTEFRGVPDPWPATCDHVGAIGDAWQPIDDFMDEQSSERVTGFQLNRDLLDESDQLTRTLVRASVESAALAAEGDSWAQVLRLYVDYVLGWFPDMVRDKSGALVRSDASDFSSELARYEVLEERCSVLGGDRTEGSGV